MHRQRNASFGGATSVVAVPGHTLRGIGVRARCEKESSGIFHVVVVGGNQHDKASNSDGVEAKQNGGTSLKSVSQIACKETEEASDDIWRHRQKLSLIVLVAEVLDNRWQEERE